MAFVEFFRAAHDGMPGLRVLVMDTVFYWKPSGAPVALVYLTNAKARWIAAFVAILRRRVFTHGDDGPLWRLARSIASAWMLDCESRSPTVAFLFIVK